MISRIISFSRTVCGIVEGVDQEFPADLNALMIARMVMTTAKTITNTKANPKRGSGNMGSVSFTKYTTRLQHRYLNADTEISKVLNDI